MAGATLHVEVDDARVRAALDRLQAAGTDLRPVMEDVGEYLLRTTRERFRDQEDPDGAPWAPLSPAYRARKRRKQNMVLTLDGYLGGGLTYRADSDSVVVGSPSIYAGTHQFGAKKGAFGATSRGSPIPWGDIPARPFLGLSSADESEVVDIILNHLRDAVR